MHKTIKQESTSAFVVLLLILFGWAIPVNAVESGKDRPPNILFILTDNQAASLIGTYGNSDIQTPNIDQLAREGIQFNHFYAVNGMCSPTRATLMTGLMPSQHGIHNWLDDEMMADWPREWSAVAEFRTLPLTLKNRGYQTALIGKWHLGQPWKASIGYEHWVTFTDGHTVDFWRNTIIDNDETYAVNDQHIVDFFTDKAVDYIESYDGEQPFYLQLNYDGPYVNPPTNLGPARNRYYKEYEGKEFPSFPRVAFNKNLTTQLMNKEDHPQFLIKKHLEGLRMHNDPATMANVASQNTIVDDGVGRVMAALKNKGLDENTLVIFSSDQGNFYGQHGLWQHTVVTTPSNLYETAMNVPLIVRHASSIEPRKASNALLGQYDLPATILDYVGIQDVRFEKSPGKSFAAGLRDSSTVVGRKLVFFEQEETRGVRSDRFAYWERIEGVGEPELYDMSVDPGQHNNLAGSLEHKKIQSRLSRELHRFFDKNADPQYDLWNGGVAKGSIVRPAMFQRLYGESWATQTKILPAFSEKSTDLN